MKKQNVTLLLMMVLMSMLAFSCSSSSNNNNEGGLVDTDLPFEDIMNDDISYLMFSIGAEGEYYYHDGMAFILGTPEQVTLTINGGEIEVSSMDFMQMSFHMFEFDLNPGQEIAYVLTADDQQYSGTIRLPAAIQSQFPQSFDLNSDNTINWNISLDPLVHIAGIEVDDYEDGIDDFFVLPGSARNYTFDRRLYSRFANSDWGYIEVGVDAVNYNVHQDLTVLASISVYHDYPLNEYKPVPKMRSFIRSKIEQYPGSAE